jgi:hypothetical protein
MTNLATDVIANEDLLGRKKFASRIVRSLTLSFRGVRESLVVGINGPWGSGKSTLLSFIEQELNEAYHNDKDKYRIIHFNPWAHASMEGDELERDLLETILRNLQEITWKQKLEEKNNHLKGYIKYLQYLKFVKHIHPVANSIFDAVEEYREKTTVHTLEEVKQQVNHLIREKEIKLYIFLDDLDRLQDREITAIFRIIKLHANFLNTCFLVAYDKTVVAQALDQAFKQRGEAYLEKIVQVDFSVPEILDEDMENILFTQLQDLCSTINFPFSQENFGKLWKFYGLKGFFRTLRDVKRYTNSLLFSLPNIGEEINTTDFFALEAIKVFDYKGYQKIYNDYLLIRQKAIWGAAAFDQTRIAEYEQPATRALLDYLFVQKGSRTNLLQGDANGKHLYDPEYFKRYYTLHMPATDITEESLVQFLSIGINREQVLEEALRHGKMKNLLQRLADDKLAKHYTITDVYIFESFLKFWDNREQSITSEIDEHLWHAYFNLAHSFPNDYDGAKAAIEALKMNESTPQALRLVTNYFLLQYHEENRTGRQLRGRVSEQLDLQRSALKESFIQHLIKLKSNWLWRAERGGADYYARIAVEAFAKHCPNHYQEQLSHHLTSTTFASFLVKTYFTFRNQDGKPIRIYLEKKEMLLPGNTWSKWIEFLQTAPKTTWNKTDQESITYLLENVTENTTEPLPRQEHENDRETVKQE